MGEDETGDRKKERHISMQAGTGTFKLLGEGLVAHLHGPTRDAIRVTDSRGWTAAGDISAGMVENASATGIASQGEHLTLETAEFLVRRLNADGATWDRPILLEAQAGRGVDCEAYDSQDRSRPPLRVQVTRPPMSEGFWKNLTRDSNAAVPPGGAKEAARTLWAAIEHKRAAAQGDVVLAINAIRTAWLAVPYITREFHDLYGAAASREGWAAIWVVGANENFTERLDRVPTE